MGNDVSQYSWPVCSAVSWGNCQFLWKKQCVRIIMAWGDVSTGRWGVAHHDWWWIYIVGWGYWCWIIYFKLLFKRFLCVYFYLFVNECYVPCTYSFRGGIAIWVFGFSNKLPAPNWPEIWGWGLCRHTWYGLGGELYPCSLCWPARLHALIGAQKRFWGYPTQFISVLFFA